MSEENVGIVRRFIGAFNRGGVEAALPFLDPEIEWNTTGIFVEPGTYRGHEGVVRYLGDVAAEFEDVHTEPEQLIDAGEQVVVPVRISGRGRQSGAAVDLTRRWWFCYGMAWSFISATTRRRPEPSKPPGCRSRRCRRKTWKSFKFSCESWGSREVGRSSAEA